MVNLEYARIEGPFIKQLRASGGTILRATSTSPISPSATPSARCSSPTGCAALGRTP